MTQVPASSHGGGLPSQWTADSNGALNIILTGASGDHDYAHALNITNSDSRSVLTLDSSGEMSISTGDASASALAITPASTIAAGTHVIQVGAAGAFDPPFDIEMGGRVTVLDQFRIGGTLAHSAPADGVINAGDLCLWFDQTNGAAKLMVKAKQANGTVVTAAIALA